MNCPRKQQLLEQRIQRAILKRVFVYWLFCVLFMIIPVLLIETISHPHIPLAYQIEQFWSRCWLSLILALLLLPLVLTDVKALSQGFLGPLFSLRRELDQHPQRTDANFVKLREADFWTELSVDISDLTTDLKRDRLGKPIG